MGAAGAVAPAGAPADRAAEQGAPLGRERHLVEVAHRRAVARPTGALRPLGQCAYALSPLAARRRLGSGASGGPERSGRGKEAGLERPLSGRHRDPSPPARSGGKGGDPAQEALGRSQGGFSTKVHLKAEGSGQPLTVLLTPGQRPEATVAPRLLRQGAVKRRGPGRPRVRPRRAVGDKGYSSRALRADCRRRGIRHTIPRRRTQQRSGPFDRAGYRLRERVERLINRCKQYHSLGTRYEKGGESYRALWTVAMTILWIKALV